MQDVAIAAVGLAFLLVGLGVGLWLRRSGLEASRAEGRRELEPELIAAREQIRSRDEQAAELRRAAEAARGEESAAQARIVVLSADLASARAQAARLPLAEKALADAARDAETRQAELRALAEEKARLQADLEAERKAARERLAEADRTREQVRAEVEKLAGRVLDEKGKSILERSEVSLRSLLDPLAEKLRSFETKVEKTYDQENRDRAQLLESLRNLQATQSKLHEDAEALGRALTGESKAQGDWGELVLERVLEAAGLTEGREYELQASHVDEDGGRKRPDALVKLPGNRVIVVDAKCSLTAFVESARAVDPAVREAALDAHVASIRTHVKLLASKSYQDVVQGRTLDIVLLFVPNEAAFHAAISRAAGLYEEAFRQRIVVCSPTTLLAALQLVSHVWRSEKQNANAQAIAEEAGKMLEKLASFVEDLDALGGRLDQAQESYASARSRLAEGRGNVMKRARSIAALGARVKSDKVDALLLGSGDDGLDAPDDPAGTDEEGGAAGSPGAPRGARAE